jgi:hypothetical protein
MADEIDPQRSQSAFLEFAAQHDDKLPDVARDGLRGAYRLHEGPLHLDHLRRPDRIDRLRSPSGRLVEPSPDQRAEPQHQGRPRHRQQVPDPLEAETSQIMDDVRRQPQRGDRQPFHGRGRRTFLDDRRPTGGEARQCMGCSPSVRDGHSRLQACLAKPPADVGSDGFLATIQMVGTGRVQHDPVRVVDGNDRRVPKCPDREPIERLRVGVRIRMLHGKVRHQRLRLGGRHARPEAQLGANRVHGGHGALAAMLADENERLRWIRRAGAHRARQAIDRPVRQVDRDDPGHRMRPR